MTSYAEAATRRSTGAPSETSAPNIVMIVFDDTGWADFGCFGSEIETPTVDRLADNGLRFTNFHVTPLCSPTRACLLTGRNHHRVGMGWLADKDFGTDGRRSRVSRRAAMLPAVLRSVGYGSYLAGKWHLAPAAETSPAGPFTEWPTNRGFDRFYGFLGGATDQYQPELVSGTEPVMPPPAPGYHLSADLVDRSMTFIADHLAFGGGRPFFLQLAFSATHTPHQVAKDYIDKYVPTFESGWDSVRDARLRRQLEMGLLPTGTSLTQRNPGVREWSSLTPGEQRLAVRLQAAYAGFLEYTDRQLGRLIEFLQSADALSNTIVLVLSDNGASDTGGDLGHVNNLARKDSPDSFLADNLERIDLIGGPAGPGSYAAGWGMAGNTPYRRYKEYVDAGGVRSPLVIHWPAGIGPLGEIRRQFIHAVDIMPTLLALVGLSMPACFDGVDQLPVDGASYADVLTDASTAAPRDTQYFEIDGLRAMQHGDYRAVAEHVTGCDYSTDVWHLYDTAEDPAENNDLAGEFPDLVERIVALWDRAAAQNGVLPLDDRRLEDLVSIETPHTSIARRRWVLRPQQSSFGNHGTGLGALGSSMRVSTRLVGPDRDGVVIASGGMSGGWCLYVVDERPVFEHHRRGVLTRIYANRLLRPEASELLVDVVPDPAGPGVTVTLSVDGIASGTAHIPSAGLPVSYRGCIEIGRDTGSVRTERHSGDFAMPTDAMACLVLEISAT